MFDSDEAIILAEETTDEEEVAKAEESAAQAQRERTQAKEARTYAEEVIDLTKELADEERTAEQTKTATEARKDQDEVETTAKTHEKRTQGQEKKTPAEERWIQAENVTEAKGEAEKAQTEGSPKKFAYEPSLTRAKARSLRTHLSQVVAQILATTAEDPSLHTSRNKPHTSEAIEAKGKAISVLQVHTETLGNLNI